MRNYIYSAFFMAASVVSTFNGKSDVIGIGLLVIATILYIGQEIIDAIKEE